jgi:hypothetical protein
VSLTFFCILLTLFPDRVCASQEADPGIRLWVLVEEKVVWVLGATEIAETSGQAEISLNDELASLGYDLVDSEMVRKNITLSQGLNTLVGDDKAVAAIGLQYGAAFSVSGNAYAKSGIVESYGAQVEVSHATVNARLIRNSDARIMASASTTASVPHPDPVIGGAKAIEKAAVLLAGKLDKKVKASMQVSRNQGAEISLHITGLVSYRHLDSIMSYLGKQVEGVESVELGAFTVGTADLTLLYKGTLGDLAGLLSNEKFTGFRLEPIRVDTNRIDLKSVDGN